MPKEDLEETEKQREKALAIQKKHGVHRGKFTFLLPERLKKLQEQIESQKQQSEQLETEQIEETEKEQVRERARRLLDRIEKELLEIELERRGWIYIREELAELSKVADEFAVVFQKNSEDDFYGIIVCRIVNGEAIPWKSERMSFAEKLFEGSTKIPKEDFGKVKKKPE